MGTAVVYVLRRTNKGFVVFFVVVAITGYVVGVVTS